MLSSVQWLKKHYKKHIVHYFSCEAPFGDEYQTLMCQMVCRHFHVQDEQCDALDKVLFFYLLILYFLVLVVEKMVKLVLEYAGVGAHNCTGFGVKIPKDKTNGKGTIWFLNLGLCSGFINEATDTLLLCFLLEFQAFDVVHISIDGVHGAVVVGLDSAWDLGQRSLFLLHLPSQTKAIGACKRSGPNWFWLSKQFSLALLKYS